MQDKKSSRDRPKRSSETKTTSGSKKRDRKSRTSRSVKPKVSAKPIKSEPVDIEPYKTNSKEEFKNDLIKRLSNAVGPISKIFSIFYGPCSMVHITYNQWDSNIIDISGALFELSLTILKSQKAMLKEKWKKLSHPKKSFKVNVGFEGDIPTEKYLVVRRRI